VPTTQKNAVRLADQASFGPTESLVATIRTQGAVKWISQQMTNTASSYRAGGSGAVHQYTSQNADFCDDKGSECWRDWSSSTPLLWDFYRNAVNQPDQLRQRVALALQQIVVVSNVEVSGTYGLRNYHNALLDQAFGNYREVLRKVALSPVMGDYLNNANNDAAAPNENFARELFELFVLGEGNYTEQDIKEAARAFTGYRQRPTGFFFLKNQHDESAKTVFGQTGAFTGDEVIDLAYKQPAASRYLPQEMARFYLSEDLLSKDYLSPLGEWWSANDYDLRKLSHRFFGSRLFFHQAFRGNYIKSPAQFYLSLVQDLNLNVAPYPRHSLNTLRLMGEELFRPPNIRGWVGGRLWINSGTLNARRQLVQTLFTPVNEDNLNADEQVELVAARSQGIGTFTVTEDRLDGMLKTMNADQITSRFVDYFLPVKVSETFRTDVRDYLTGETREDRKVDRLKNTVITLLQSPEYQLC
jgi:uncharacterized protein (DUF1800 family)